MSLLLAPAYTSFRKQTLITRRTFKTWPEDVHHQLQDCFEITNWDIFDHPDLEEFTAAVLGYINYCMDSVAVGKGFQVNPNQKLWMTRDVQRLLQERHLQVWGWATIQCGQRQLD